MKDLAHHLKKLNRRIIRSMHREELENEKFEEEPPRKQTPQEMKKIKKRAALKARIERTPIHPSLEERNRKMKKRVPIFDKISKEKPKFGKPSRKKVPKI